MTRTYAVLTSTPMMALLCIVLAVPLGMLACGVSPTAPTSGKPKGYLDWSTPGPGPLCKLADGVVTIGGLTEPATPMIRDGAALGLPMFRNFVITKWQTVTHGPITAVFTLREDETFGICFWFQTPTAQVAQDW